jgi:hypothetical protein
MRTRQLLKNIPDIPTVRILIEFPQVGGPFYTPGQIKVLKATGTFNHDGAIIEADFPRTEVTGDQFAKALRAHTPDGAVHVHLVNVGYFNIERVRARTEQQVIIVCGDFREECRHTVWPYTEHNICIRYKSHDGDHEDDKGRLFDNVRYIEAP